MSDPIRIDCDFPGGNILVDRIEGDDVYVRQDLRDTDGHWFYWSFRALTTSPRQPKVHFSNGRVIGTRGPAVSMDGGKQWSWLGTSDFGDDWFTYSVPQGVSEVRFSVGIPYQEADFDQFLRRWAGDKQMSSHALCVTPKGRNTPVIQRGSKDRPFGLILACRHHACEAMASYVLEGFLEGVLEGSSELATLRDRVAITAIPFIDLDGVEAGDQGKNRKPRDHNLDYSGENVYRCVEALQQLIADSLAPDRPTVVLDLHCPSLRENKIYLVGSRVPSMWQSQVTFANLLASERNGPLPYRPEDNLPYGQGWNRPSNYAKGRSFCDWADEQPGVVLSVTVETPYSDAHGVEVNKDSARQFGRDVAAATERYFLDMA